MPQSWVSALIEAKLQKKKESCTVVYVQSKDGRPLMPTRNHRKVRFLLNERAAKVVKRTPFTIRLHMFGFQLFDKVLCEGKECFIFGRRTSGYFSIRKLNGDKISAGINYDKLHLLEKRTNLLIEKEDARDPITAVGE